MLRYSALLLPFALSACAALELAGRADELQQVVDLGTEFQDAINASDGGRRRIGVGGTTVPDGSSWQPTKTFRAGPVRSTMTASPSSTFRGQTRISR